MKDEIVIDSSIEWQRFFYWWSARENLTLGQAIEQWKKIKKTTKGYEMRKIILSMENCQKCEMLKVQCPDAEVVKAEPSELLQFARLVGIQGMPFVVVTGEPNELAEVLK